MREGFEDMKTPWHVLLGVIGILVAGGCAKESCPNCRRLQEERARVGAGLILTNVVGRENLRGLFAEIGGTNAAAFLSDVDARFDKQDDTNMAAVVFWVPGKIIETYGQQLSADMTHAPAAYGQQLLEFCMAGNAQDYPQAFYDRERSRLIVVGRAGQASDAARQLNRVLPALLDAIDCRRHPRKSAKAEPVRARPVPAPDHGGGSP